MRQCRETGGARGFYTESGGDTTLRSRGGTKDVVSSGDSGVPEPSGHVLDKGYFHRAQPVSRLDATAGRNDFGTRLGENLFNRKYRCPAG